jgi:hypothetical protein
MDGFDAMRKAIIKLLATDVNFWDWLKDYKYLGSCYCIYSVNKYPVHTYALYGLHKPTRKIFIVFCPHGNYLESVEIWGKDIEGSGPYTHVELIRLSKYAHEFIEKLLAAKEL